MSNILISYFSAHGVATYDAICDSLRQNGNNVLRLNTFPHISFDQWAGKAILTDKSILPIILEFKPDIVINFSHTLPIEIVDALPESCKICLLDGDTAPLFWNKDKIPERHHRYMYLGTQTQSREFYETTFNITLDESNYLYFPSATSLNKADLDPTMNISFVGTPFGNYFPTNPEDEFFSSKMFVIYNLLKNNYDISIDTIRKTYQDKYKNIDVLVNKVRGQIAGQQRLLSLSVLSDLGLKIFGTPEWRYVANTDIELAQCFDPKPISTLLENEEIYNRSKICVNISHPQATTAFSWRVMDIMASSACLLMENKLDWHNLFAPYIPQRVIDTIIYRDRYDMREKAKRLLEDEELRLECVKACQFAIEQNGRWHHRYKDLQRFLNIQLLGLENVTPIYIHLGNNSKDAKKPRDENSTLAQHFKKLKMMNRIKNIYYLLIILTGQLLLIDKIANRKIRQKALKGLHKYWR